MKPLRERALPRPLHLEGLDRYEPGLPIESVRREMGLERVIKLASNENPLGPSPKAIAAVGAAMAGVHRYPDGPATALREALAARLRVAPSQVAIGNGSTDLIDLLARAYLAPGDKAVIAERAFSRFRQCVDARNGGSRLVAMRDLTHDLEAMRAACDSRTRLLFVANPNNPTGTWNPRRELDALFDRLPDGVLLVLDEAYFEYAQGGDYPNGVDYVRAGAPVAVLRTFSKVYGLAGLRVGYVVAAPEVIEALDTVREPFNANALGQAGALAALDDEDHVRRAVELNRVQKQRLAPALTARGLGVLPSLGNFLCVDTRRDAALVFRRLLEKGVIVRPLRPYGLPASLRISVGTAAENELLLDAVDAVLPGIPTA